MKHKTLSILLVVLMSMTVGVVCAEEHEYVDLGLPSGTLWATCNVGASSPEEYGDYFAWGETDPKSEYSWNTYKWCNGSITTQTKYCNDSSCGYNGFTDTLTELELSDDAAYMNWGNNWCTPSLNQFEELINSSYTTKEWMVLNGVYGFKITSKINGNSIFLPAAGYLNEWPYNTRGDYWSRTFNTGFPSTARRLYFDSGKINTWTGSRGVGMSVRPVRNLPKCATPTISYKNGRLTFACDTEGAQFVSEITDTDIKAYNEAEINLSVTYTVRVHATHPDYYDSEEAVATLCWIEVEPKTEGIETDVKEMSALPVLIQSYNGTLRITGAEDGSPVSVYTTSGQLLGTSTVHGNEASITSNLHEGVAIVKIGSRTVKVLIK